MHVRVKLPALHFLQSCYTVCVSVACRLHALESARAEAEARSAAHAAGEEVLRLQLKHLQTEVAALQQELVRAGAAAGASAAAAGGYQLYPSGEVGAVAAAVVSGTGGGPVQLPQVLRELGQWQRRAQEAELALDEVGSNCGLYSAL